MLGQGSLKINNITKADEGKYTCRGANSMDTADTEVSLSVLSKSFFSLLETFLLEKCDKIYPTMQHYYGVLSGDAVAPLNVTLELVIPDKLNYKLS